jgi:hypothetical protein
VVDGQREALPGLAVGGLLPKIWST